MLSPKILLPRYAYKEETLACNMSVLSVTDVTYLLATNRVDIPEYNVTQPQASVGVQIIMAGKGLVPDNVVDDLLVMTQVIMT